MARKGQVSTEYLVILAVVLAVGLVVVALVGGMSPLSSGISESASRDYWTGVSPFAITAWKYSGTELDLTLQSQGGQMLTLTSITGADGLSYTNASTFSVGQVETVAITGMVDCGALGTSYDISNVSLTYTEGSIGGFQETGGKDIVGACS